MGNLVNVNAESGADIIGDDAQPTLTLKNTSTAPGLWSQGIAVTSTASVDVAVFGGNILAANATIGQQVQFSTASRASGAIFKFATGLVSLTSVLATTGGVAGTYGVRVVKPDGTFGWIPVYPDGAVTAAAI